MARRICVVEDCGSVRMGRGLCTRHYNAWYRDRDLFQDVIKPSQQGVDPVLSFWRQVDTRGEEGCCWQWIGKRKWTGYGIARIAPARSGTTAHRVMYELLVGPIPEGLELDHLCRNRACVNPDHLEPVTHLENVRRGHASRKSSAAAKTSVENSTKEACAWNVFRARCPRA